MYNDHQLTIMMVDSLVGLGPATNDAKNDRCLTIALFDDWVLHGEIDTRFKPMGSFPPNHAIFITQSSTAILLHHQPPFTSDVYWTYQKVIVLKSLLSIINHHSS